MRRDTDLDGERILLDLMFGILAILSLVLVGLAIRGWVQLYYQYGVVAILVPVCFPILWVIGHICQGMFLSKQICRGDGCNYKFGNIFTEWYHKRSCLPYLTRSVGNR